MLDSSSQRECLLKITQGSGFGLLIIVDRPGDVVFAASPVFGLIGCEFVCASSDEKYDVWKDGTIETTGLNVEQVREYIKERTPEWMYDGSPVTEFDGRLVIEWIRGFERRYGVKVELPGREVQ